MLISIRGWILYAHHILSLVLCLIQNVQCHLRVASPQHATTLVAWFEERDITQVTGLDGAGASGTTRLRMEVVQGRQEELYWEKVPLKVRREAMGKAEEPKEGTQKKRKRKK